jgi:uncharacterized protein (TIGR00255 family)
MKSMTGYGKTEIIDEKARVKVEIKSINSRYLDLQFNIPSELRGLESSIRNKVAAIIKRGRVDCYIYLEKFYEGSKKLKINKDLVNQLLNELKDIQNQNSMNKELRLDRIISLPGIIEMESDVQEIPQWLLDSLDAALSRSLAETDKMRVAEGARLKESLIKSIDAVAGIIEKIKTESESVNEGLIEKYRARLRRFAKEVEMDENRLSMEAAISAERADISEEIVRLESHVKEISSCIMIENETAGKRLDFLLQEMSREANTLNAKTAGMLVNLLGVEMKLEIEKMREQVQNIE